MKRNDALTIIKAHKEQLQQMGVKSLDLFGSVARSQKQQKTAMSIFW
jgi:hypothetical protein